MSYSENNTYEKILNRMLARDALINVDKRVGSIIYDAIAPCAMELADAYVIIDILQEQTYLLTATGNNLDKRCFDYGIKRNQATKAQRIGSFKKYQVDGNGNFVFSYNYVGENQGDYVKGDKILIDMDIPVGSRFVVPDNENIIFEYIGIIDGYKILQCESSGSGGNEHVGDILPLSPITDMIESKIISTYKYGEDKESDDDLRTRTQNYLNETAFGGNIADYIEKVNSIDGVGNVKVFPAWQRNGSVLLSVVDPSFNPITNEFATYLKELIDPEENSGQGVGIAPIGHIVTITTPVEQTIDVELTLKIEENVVQDEISSEVITVIENYIQSVKEQFAQDVNLAIYRSRIIDRLFDNISEILNVKDVLLNNTDADIIYTDEGLIGRQYLPKLGEVTVNYE